MDIIARADGGGGDSGDGGGGATGGGGSEALGTAPTPESITVTGSRIEDFSGSNISIDTGSSFSSMLDGLNARPPAAPAGGVTNFTVTSHKSSTPSASSQGSDQTSQSSSDGSSSTSSAPGTSGRQTTVSSTPPQVLMPSGDPDGSSPDDSGSPGASFSSGGSGGGGSGGARTEASGISSQAAAAAVTADYQRILGRAPDAGGLASYTQAILLGHMNLVQVAQSMATSPEARNDLKGIISDVQGRQATAGDQPWIQAQEASLGNGGASLSGIRQSLADFPGEAGVIMSMYQGLVDRAPSAAEISATEAQLAAGVSLQTIRTADATSPEAVGRLNGIYQNDLGRQADPSGLANDEGFLAGGGTLPQVADSVAHSPEAAADIGGLVRQELGTPLGATPLAGYEDSLAAGETLSSLKSTIDASKPVTSVLHGTTYTLPGWHLQEISYTKRSNESRQALREAFRPVRKAFLKELASTDMSALMAAGLTSDQIARMASGRNPQGYEVHHILPLDDGGTNAFNNLVLIRNEPDHYLLTNYQNSITENMKASQTQMLEWPILDQPTLIWPTQPDGGAISVPTLAAA